jgi:hypothetical protein
MANERITEGFVRDHFQKHSTDGQLVEEQSSLDPTISRALKAASKQGIGIGRPEFIVTLDSSPSEVIIIECKAAASNHESAHHKNREESAPEDISSYAVDGVLHYARHVAKYRNVIAVAVSGQKKSELRVSTYRHIKGMPVAAPLLGRDGSAVERLRTVADYVELFRYDRTVIKGTLDRLTAYSRQVHNFLRDYAKVTEAEKPLVISAILLALRHPSFRAGWQVASDQDLPTETLQAVEKGVKKAINSAGRRELMMAAYSFVPTHPELTKVATIRFNGQPEVTASPLRYLIGSIEEDVLPFAMAYPHVDVIGQFYAEFLRYTGGDGKGLGIVLTPRHITELFVHIAHIGKNDTVLDPCAGTGGFLISAMATMDHLARDNEETKTKIRENQLIGIEQQPAMFALCVSNMVLRGDGRSNLHRGDCFDEKLQNQIINPTRLGLQRPNKGLINPPYAQKGEEQHELDFVKAMLDMLVPGGIGVAVVPMSCAIAVHPARGRLLNSHTLTAAMSLNDELFYPVGVVACTLVFRAHTPHEETDAPTWFGYWKDDGFTKVKHQGRVDLYHKWEAIQRQWLTDYRGMAESPGKCIKHRVTVEDEWCAEAYLETDYTALQKDDFERVVREYALFVLGQQTDEVQDAEAE